MSLELLNRNPDLQQLRNDGYAVQVVGGYLIMHEVPYVDRAKKVRRGILVSTLTLAGERTIRPDNHVMYFTGEFPCDANGMPLINIAHVSQPMPLVDGIIAQHSFSSKPPSGYQDYYEKMTTYASILTGPAMLIEPDATARVFRVEGYDDIGSVFTYSDTNSARARISSLNRHLATETVAIIGLGGSGSYILDLVSKSPVASIRLYDGKDFLQHNAFRAPGAASIEELRNKVAKTDYFQKKYARMHRHISAFSEPITEHNLHLLEGITFAFLCIDSGHTRELLVRKFEEMGISFIDVGMGIEFTEDSLGGILRVTSSTPWHRDSMHSGRVPFEDIKEEDVYDTNVQIAEFNSLTAAMAVIKWKKLRGYFRDLDCEYHSTYTTDGNMLLNGRPE